MSEPDRDIARTQDRQHARRLLSVGVILIVVGAAVLLVSVMKGWGAGFGAFPGMVIVLLGGVFVLIAEGVEHVDLMLGDHRAGLHVNSEAVLPARSQESDALPEALDAIGSAGLVLGKQRHRRQCRLTKRNRSDAQA